MRNLLADFRYAARQLRRRWSFASIAVITLALGIGGASAVLAIEHALTPDPDRFANLDGVFSPTFRYRPGSMALPATRSIDQIRVLESNPPPPIQSVVGVTHETVILRAPGNSEIVRAEVVTGGYAAMFGIRAGRGRMIAPEDDTRGAPLTVVVSDRLWRDAFGGDRSVIGQMSVRISRLASATMLSRSPPFQSVINPPVYQSFSVVGVATPGYHGLLPTDAAARADVWLSERAWEALSGDRNREFGRSAFVRPTPGARVAEIALAFNSALAAASGGARIEATPAAEFLRQTGQVATFAGLLSLAFFILIAACANVANMLFARGAERAGEVSIRLSLGASSARVFRLFAAESALIGAAAALIAFPVALGAVRLFGMAVPTLGLGRSADRVWSGEIAALSPVSAVAFLTLGVAFVAVLVVGTVSAWRVTRAPTNRAFAAAGTPAGITPGNRRASLGFVTIQVTAALLLVMAAGLYAESYRETLDRHLEFDTSRVAAAEINLTYYGFTDERGRAFYRQLVGDGHALPGLESVALADQIPGTKWLPNTVILVAEDEAGRPRVPGSLSPRVSGRYSRVSPGFFETLGLRIVRGRPLWPADQNASELVTVVTEHVAAMLWPGQDPIGKRLIRNDTPLTVVGVCADPATSRGASPLVHPASFAFTPVDQPSGPYASQMFVLARSHDSVGALRALQAGVRAIDDQVALQRAGTLDEAILAWVGPLRAAALLMGSLGLLALVISALGVYGVLAHTVSRRRREFGVRLALGATPRRLFVMVTDQAISMLLVGLLPGVLIASLGSNTVSHWLPGVQPNSIAMWIAAPLVILVIGLAAAFVPARRAAGVDPNVALREL